MPRIKELTEDDSEISISFVTNDDIQEINKTYRGKDQPTDVISFALEEMGEGEIEISGIDGHVYLGISSFQSKKRTNRLWSMDIHLIGNLVF